MAEFSTDLPEGTKVKVVEFGDRYTLVFLTPRGDTIGLSMAPAEFDGFEDFVHGTHWRMAAGQETTL